MKNKKGKSLLGLALLIAAIGLFGYFGYSTMGAIKLGLDLAGGVSITYQAKEANPSAEDMSDTIYKLRLRVENYSSEAEVYQEGVNRINVDIPGVSDANAILQDLGQPGSLVFMDSEGNQILEGRQVTSAKGGIIDQNGVKEYVVQLAFDEEGTKAFADATTNGVGKPIYIIYDGRIISYPMVREPITGGQCRIDGMADLKEAEELAANIRIGSLSLELEELRSNVVGAKLGQEAISTSLKAGAIGFAIVVVFMIAVYLIPGVAASLALCLYVGLILVLLKAFEITLTLPGVAGIVLSIGMAVDANVIIFTRIKEEIGVGKTVKSAIKTGFAKALSAIIDGNVTTLIAAAVLFWRGSGTVKGFASTLALGIVLSMVTALFITKFALNCLYEAGFEDVKFYGVRKDIAARPFLKPRKAFFGVSLLLIVAGFAAMGVNRASTGAILNYGMEFRGGTSTNVTFNEDLSLERISSEVVPVVEQITGEAGTQTQKVAGTNEVIIKTRTLNMEEREALDTALADKFGVDPELITADSISGAISAEMKRDAIVAVTIATICMLIYIWFRFSNITFAASAVLALVHDVLVVLTFYAALKWSISSTFIACMLTIVGYSINATIVIFDRIRENMKLKKYNQTIEDVVNLSITQTFTRSINTSLTTFIMVFVLFVMGVSSIREFALPMMVGIVCGTYSSVFLTGAMWYVFSQKKEKKNTDGV
ncbi:protein translocase subunit SecD [Otoolea muris]|uniref:protein translocase subunit SecD n=1 Tax=Otoolea muris TaxID=2941515 RepID=UPI00203EDFD4|nr:protein translocase subunit SecD [Otoolea muris]